jgi:protein-disulfide isomerase
MRSFLALTAVLVAAFLALVEVPGRVVAEPLGDAERAELHAEIRSYLLENPEILREMIAMLEAQDQAGAAVRDRELVAAHAEAIFDDGFSFVGGNPEGSLTVVEFLDYQCGYCRRAHPDVADLIAEDGDIRWIVKEMPILGPGSELAARAAVATLIVEGPAVYRPLHDQLMRSPGQIDDAVLDDALRAAGADPATIRAAMDDDPEVSRRLAETRALAQTLAISGTPTFVFGDLMVRGYLPLAQMQSLVAELRAD